MERKQWRLGTLIAGLLLVALAIVACGPEAVRERNGGQGASNAISPPPTVVSAPALVVQPTTNIPYATAGALPTLPPLPTATLGPATPVNQPAVPTAPPGPANPATPGRGGTPQP